MEKNKLTPAQNKIVKYARQTNQLIHVDSCGNCFFEDGTKVNRSSLMCLKKKGVAECACKDLFGQQECCYSISGDFK